MTRAVYHYAPAGAIAAILRDGVIRASSTRLYRDLLMTEVARDTEPIVWLTINPHMELTTLVKVALDGPPSPGSIGRIALPHGYAGDLGLGEYTEAEGIPHADWLWCVRTGELAGSNYTTWRIVPRDIPRADWLAVERWDGMGDGGFLWSPWR